MTQQIERTPIRPAAVKLTYHDEPTRAGQRRMPWHRLAVVLAVLVSSALLGWLATDPAMQRPPTAGHADRQTPEAAVVPLRPSDDASVWTDAKLIGHRRAAQDHLAAVLELRQALTTQHVELWGRLEYDEALHIADAGDLAYRQARFAEAEQRFEQARTQLEALLSRATGVASKARARGRDALEQGDADTARAEFALALAIDPQDEEAARGHARTGTLDQVIALLHLAQAHEHAGQLNEARAVYRQALKLDPEAAHAQAALVRIDSKERDAAFASAMSEGFAALERARFAAARLAFQRAASIKPHDPAVRDAQAQLSNRITLNRINTLLQEARSLEAAEQWRRAAEVYGDALKIDANLKAARAGKQRATYRAGLAVRLKRALARPERLGSPQVYQETRALQAHAKALPERGPRLQEQLAKLTDVLTKASIPVTVQLRSDNQTNVTLYRVAELGTFETHRVSLRPGSYVAIGYRKGYRDVRVEFVVKPDSPPPFVIVRCTEPIPF